MIDFLIHVTMGIAIGAYMFNEKVRSGANRIVISLFTSLMNYMKSGKMSGKTTAKRAVRQEKQEPVGYKTNGTVKSLRTTDDAEVQLQNVKGLYPCTCGGILEPVKDWQGYYACAKCHSLKTLK